MAWVVGVQSAFQEMSPQVPAAIAQEPSSRCCAPGPVQPAKT